MECVQVRRGLDTFVSGFGDADTSSEIPWISRKDKKEGRSLHEKGIFQILVYLIQVIYAVELSLFWRFICEIYNSLNSLLRPHSSVTCPSSSRDRPPYTYENFSGARLASRTLKLSGMKQCSHLRITSGSRIQHLVRRMERVIYSSRLGRSDRGS